MKNKALLLIIPTLAISACTVKLPWEKVYDNDPFELIMDNTFQKGFLAIHGVGTPQLDYSDPANPVKHEDPPEGRYVADVALKYNSRIKDDPSWTLRQNNDVYNLNDIYYSGKKADLIDGYHVFSDPSKILAVKPGEGKLYMELNSSVEYWRNRNTLDTWAHMLIASSLTKSVGVKDYDKFILSLDIQMHKCEDHTLTSWSYTRSAQFLMYIQMSSASSTEDSDRTFWFGIPFYDSTQPYARDMVETAAKDFAVGTNTGGLIYKVPGTAIYGDENVTLEDYQIHHIEIDLKDYFKRAIDLAHTPAINFWTKTKVDDLVMTDMNLGFELPGRYDIGIEISNLSLKAS